MRSLFGDVGRAITVLGMLGVCGGAIAFIAFTEYFQLSPISIAIVRCTMYDKLSTLHTQGVYN
ncbi:hypothetical protein IQ237_11855 [Sphaerospermopsis sp. LEGE 08334]|nr:hypothetical protein [Sphaerospermopsis sp. LEGE 08334]